MRTRQQHGVPPLVLAERTFVVLWEKLGFGDLPRPLFIPSPGATDSERAAIERAAALDLVHHGIGYGAGSDEGVEGMLAVLARPACEYYGWVVAGDAGAIGFTASTDGRGAVVAKLADGFVHLAPLGTPRLAWALCAELPLRASLPGTAISLPREAPELRELAADAVVRAQFFVAVRDRAGRRRQSEHPVGYVETPHGSWLLHAPAADDRITAAPASPDALAIVLDQTRDRLTPASPPFPARESRTRVAPVPRSKD